MGLVKSVIQAALVLTLVAGCAGVGVDPAHDGQLRVVTTTGILADLVRNVAGDRATVSQLVPDGADPHSYEPSLRAIRDVAYADLAFSNYLLLEQHSIIRALDANLPASAQSVSIAEEAAKQGATILPLVEDRALDTLWLGMRVSGDGKRYGANRASEVDLQVVSVQGPGQASSYLTTTFGTPELGFSSHDGFDAASDYKHDTVSLPADAHQHMSWAFTKPGVYRVQFKARLRPVKGKNVEFKTATFTFAVGVDAAAVAKREGRVVLGPGHGDVSVDLEAGRITLVADKQASGQAWPSAAKTASASTPSPAASANTNPGASSASAPSPGGSASPTPSDGASAPSQSDVVVAGAAHVPGHIALDPQRIVVDVPTRTLAQVPQGYGFVGRAGTQAYILPQAVLGKHVHGEIDPHLWHDVHNAAAYVKVICAKLKQVDPAGARVYDANAARYLNQLAQLDTQVKSTLDTISEANRQLVTTNDAYAYLANAYGLKVAGFVAPNPASEPSLADRRKLAATIKDLHIKAVFLEPNLARTRSTLKVVASEAGVKVCPLYGDTLDNQAPTYQAMMRFNANSLARCLGGRPGAKATASSAKTPGRAATNPATSATPSVDPALEQNVAANEPTSQTPAVIEAGHVDLGPRLIGGKLTVSLRDDSAASPVWRDPNKTVLRVRDGALIQVPQGEDYKFLADSKRVYVLPQTQKTQLVWLGWNTQDPAVTKLIKGGVNMRIEQVKGPGRSWLILQEGTFGKPKVLADSAASAQDIWVDTNTHVHANWIFSKPGIYLVKVSFKATGVDGKTYQATTTLRFAVGDATSTTNALKAQPSGK
ncbi:anchored repeat ABC transporter, substrate-binding protein [Actinomyces graevenitzii]|uniref:anchored repeat ABC transporter, substrate-binding protein n=1 Tax=Actinomyces graevenitzii TaxID=55565 RepID=UPI000C80081F|nr:anchored repeat ABC transporter, substrate-binding protein [Actinomyces graevenitzii]PMC91370.1 anchored repeat ABC transporter, substrate-binding protein [Actinomyces graevenitzii]